MGELFSEQLRQAIERSGMSRYAIGQAAGIDKATMSRFMAGKVGLSLESIDKIWYVRVRDESGRQREVKAGPDKSIANQMKRDLESKTQRIKAGVLDPREADAMEAERIPITKHVADYIQNLEARGACPDHLENVRKRLDWLLAETAI